MKTRGHRRFYSGKGNAEVKINTKKSGRDIKG